MERTTRPSSFRINTNRKSKEIDFNKIIRLESDINYTFVHTEDETFLCTQTLKSFEKRLDSNKFIRTHKSHIVNKSHIKDSTLIDKKGELILLNGAKIVVSRRRAKIVKSLLDPHKTLG